MGDFLGSCEVQGNMMARKQDVQGDVTRKVGPHGRGWPCGYDARGRLAGEKGIHGAGERVGARQAYERKGISSR